MTSQPTGPIKRFCPEPQFLDELLANAKAGCYYLASNIDP